MITVELFESDFNKKPNRTTTVAEGIRADYQRQVFDQILDGELDAYDVMNHPRGGAQEYVAMILQDMYDDVAREHRLHPDDNFEEILDIVVDRIEKDYGHSADRGVAEAGQNFRRGNARRAALNAMSPEELKAYEEKRAEQQRKRDEARLERERQRNAAKKGVAEGHDTAEDYRAKAQWLRSELHLSPDEAWERAYDTDPDTWVGSPWEDDYKQGVAEGSEYKSRHAHKQEQDKAYNDYRTKHATSRLALMTRAEFAKDQRERAAKKKQGVAEGYQFKGPFPFDVDHMHGGRGINLPKAETKKYFTDKKQWQRAVDDINSSKYDDNSDYIGVTGRSTVEINGREWARWSDAQQKGYIELSSMSEQGVAEAQPEPEQQQIDANRRAALRREREPAGSDAIDARLAQQHAQRQEYEKTGKFWLKQKDTQQHISDVIVGKAAANAAALALLKQRPELKGNLVITAYGPDEQQNIKEEVRLPYPEGSENLGRANMELLIRAYNEPTSSRIRLNFGNKSVELDREDVAAIAEYYDDKLPSNEARWNFIRAVMNNHDNFNQVLHQIGRRSATNVRQPGLFQEADKKKDKDDLGSVTDVGLQRAISRAKADFPTAGSGIEALAKDFMRSQDQDRQDFERLQSAERKQDQLLSQISKVDREQEQEINNLETQNSAMSQRLQQLQNVNAELEKKLSAMTGRKEKRQAAKTTSPAAAGSAVSVPTVVAPKPAAKPRIKKQAAPKSKPIKIKPSAAMGNIATQLAPQAQAQLPAPDQGDVLPPMFRSKPNPELQRGKDTAVDAQYRDMPAAFATSENKQNKPEVDYDDPRWDAMVSRVGKLAKSGPLKTVWDPVKRVYKNVPADTEKKPVKEQEPGNRAGFEAIKSVSDWAEKIRIMRELQKDMVLMADAEARATVQQQLRELLAHGIQQGYVK